MKSMSDFQQKQLEAIQKLYNSARSKGKQNFSLTDVIISWFTDGYAERFRDEYLKKHPIFS